MPSFQSIQAMGNLGKDPETKTFGDKVNCKFSLAVSEKYGEKEHTEWFNVVLWGKQAEICKRYLSKGDCVIVAGRLETREYDDKNTGEKKRWTDLVADKVRFVKTKKIEDNAAPKAEEKTKPIESINLDDIPF